MAKKLGSVVAAVQGNSGGVQDSYPFNVGRVTVRKMGSGAIRLQNSPRKKTVIIQDATDDKKQETLRVPTMPVVSGCVHRLQAIARMVEQHTSEHGIAQQEIQRDEPKADI